MNSSKTVIFILFSLLFLTVSCQNMGPSKPNDPYYSGTHAGKLLAKQDALHYRCIDYNQQLSNFMRARINTHLKEDESTRSAAYIKGFKWGYRVAFRDYTDTYCHGDNYSEFFNN
jgi:hypothetical protein